MHGLLSQFSVCPVMCHVSGWTYFDASMFWWLSAAVASEIEYIKHCIKRCEVRYNHLAATPPIFHGGWQPETNCLARSAHGGKARERVLLTKYVSDGRDSHPSVAKAGCSTPPFISFVGASLPN